MADLKTLTLNMTAFDVPEYTAGENVNISDNHVISMDTTGLAEQFKELYGTPLTASTASGMTDRTRVYVYTGNETGYNNGHWYYWDGNAWADGGVYNSEGVTTDTTLTLEGVPADAKATGDWVRNLANTNIALFQALADESQARQDADEALQNTKANIDGYYEDMTVGNSEQLVSTMMTEDKVPYKYRTSGGSIDIGNREYDKIVGGTVVWNQLVDENTTSVTIQSGHKYYANIDSVKTVGASTGTAIAVNDVAEDNLIDLTQLFGSTIADYVYSLEQATTGAGVQWFKKLFPKDYYEYNAGELLSVEDLQSHDMVGFNQWDEEWEVGTFDQTTGEKISGNLHRSKNPIGVFPNTEYCRTKTGTGLAFRLFYYDGNMNLISTDVASANVLVFTTPTNCRYINIAYQDAITNICINLSWSGYRNGEYEPYVKHSYPLDSTLTLRGIPKLDANNNLYYDGDTYEADGTVTRRYGIVDLGTLTWALYTADTTNHSFVTTGITDLSYVAQTDVMNARCTKYEARPFGGSVQIWVDNRDKAIATLTNPNRVVVRDSSYTDAASFKTAMSGVYLVYELATPTTESAEPFQNPQIVEDWGTEEYVTSSIVPVGHDTEYPQNLRDKLQHLPDLADSDGYYMINQTNNSMTLERFRIPKAPTTDGTYVLKATVSGGTPTYTWEVVE